MPSVCLLLTLPIQSELYGHTPINVVIYLPSLPPHSLRYCRHSHHTPSVTAVTPATLPPLLPSLPPHSLRYCRHSHHTPSVTAATPATLPPLLPPLPLSSILLPSGGLPSVTCLCRALSCCLQVGAA